MRSTANGLMAPRYLVAAYHHFENGFDDKLDYYTLEEAEKAAQGYVDGTMEDDGFKYDGAAVYDQQEHKCIRIYGDYPDEKAHAQVRASAEPEQQEPEHFIDHFYVAEDIQKRGALDIKEYSSFDDALRAYYALPDTQRIAVKGSALIFLLWRSTSMDRIFMDEYYEHLRADNIEAFSKERNDEYVGRAEEYKAAKSALLEGLGLEHLFDHSHELTPKEKEIWMLFDRVDVAELLARDAFAKGAYMLGAEDREIMLK